MIYVTFQRKGIHRYPAASADPRLTDVSYLGNEHRHLFKFKVSIAVKHDDREIEFHQFLNWLEFLYDKHLLELDHKSCEMIADDLYCHIKVRYPKRQVIIEVSEDGECGCVIEYTEDWE
jgi:hypothetical protein